MTERTSDEWAVTLVAYANGTLELDERADVDAALASSADLRRELDEIKTLRRALRRDDAPPAIPTAVWDRIQEPEAAPEPWPPPAGPARPIADVVPLRRRRRALVAVTAAAAAALVVVVGAIVINRGGDERSDELAEPTPTTRPALEATPPTDASSDSPPSPLDAPAPQALMQTEVAMASARTALLDVSGTGLASFDGSAIGEDGTVEVGVALSGEGAVDFGDGSPRSSAYRLTIRGTAVSGPEAVRPDDFEQSTIVVDGTQYSSEDGGPYTEDPAGTTPDDQGLFARIALNPDILARLPDLAEGEIEDLGVEQLDGVDARHLRFDLEQSAEAGPDEEQVAEVWIDEDGTVRQLRLILTEPLELDLVDDDGELEVTVDIALRDFGTPVEITAPS